MPPVKRRRFGVAALVERWKRTVRPGAGGGIDFVLGLNVSSELEHSPAHSWAEGIKNRFPPVPRDSKQSRFTGGNIQLALWARSRCLIPWPPLPQKFPILQKHFPISKNLSTRPKGSRSHVTHHIPMQPRLIHTAGLRKTRTNRGVKRAADLLIEHRVLHELGEECDSVRCCGFDLTQHIST